MTNESTQVIEINGVKMEVDMRYAKRVDRFRVGSKVKMLIKDGNRVVPGVVVGFEPFDSLPTIVVSYVDDTWSGVEIKFAYVNSESAGKYELMLSVDDEMPIARDIVLNKMQKQEEEAIEKLNDIRKKRDYFLQHFGCYYEPEKEETEAA